MQYVKSFVYSVSSVSKTHRTKSVSVTALSPKLLWWTTCPLMPKPKVKKAGTEIFIP